MTRTDRIALYALIVFTLAGAYAAWDASMYARKARELSLSTNAAVGRVLVGQTEIKAKLDMLDAIARLTQDAPTGQPEGYGAAGDEEPKGARPIRTLLDQANEAAIESRDLMKKVDATIEDVKSGRLKVRIKGGILSSDHEVSIEQR
jgi:hypothetical protein